MKKTSMPFNTEGAPVRILGADFDLIREDALIQQLEALLSVGSEHRQILIANHNLHGIFCFHNDSDYRKFADGADIRLIDGIPLVWFARLTGKRQIIRSHRNTPLDYCIKLMAKLPPEPRRKVYILGGTPESSRSGIEAWRRLYPHLDVDGGHGYFDWTSEGASRVERINAFGPDLLFICLGMPLQEKWALRFGPAVRARIIIPAGGLLDYYSGKTSLTPRWVGQLGLEWLYRFIHDPRRLFFRYFIEPWFLLPYFFKDATEYAVNILSSKNDRNA